MVALTKHEHALLLLLTRNLDSVINAGQILTEIWGQSHSNDIAYFRVYVGRLRAKLGPEFAPLIVTESGVGYRMQIPLALERLSSFDPCGEGYDDDRRCRASARAARLILIICRRQSRKLVRHGES